MKPILILAGGFGTRLRAVIPDIPKPLAPVAGRPFLSYLIEHCISQGADDLVFLLHYKSKMIEDSINYISKSEMLKGVKLRMLKEDFPMGTGGSIKNAIMKLRLEQSFLVMNADTWLGTGIKRLVNFNNCALASVKVKDCQRYGSLVIRDNIVEEFQEKSTIPESGWINAGLYHLHPKLFIKYSNLNSFSLEQLVFRDLVKERKLSALKIDTQFIDIGVPDDYTKFCNLVELGVLDEL